MYPHSPGLVDRLARNSEGQDGKANAFEIDASLVDVSQTALFEMKAVFLLESAITDPKPEVFLKEIRARYSGGARKGERDKGVAQLARSVGAVVRGEWKGRGDEFEPPPSSTRCLSRMTCGSMRPRSVAFWRTSFALCSGRCRAENMCGRSPS